MQAWVLYSQLHLQADRPQLPELRPVDLDLSLMRQQNANIWLTMCLNLDFYTFWSTFPILQGKRKKSVMVRSIINMIQMID